MGVLKRHSRLFPPSQPLEGSDANCNSCNVGLQIFAAECVRGVLDNLRGRSEAFSHLLPTWVQKSPKANSTACSIVIARPASQAAVNTASPNSARTDAHRSAALF